MSRAKMTWSAPVVALLNNPVEWKSTIYGRNGFRKKARLGAPAGIELFELELNANNVKSASIKGELEGFRAGSNGKLARISVPMESIVAAYDFYCAGEPDCGQKMDSIYFNLMSALVKAGKPFVNPPQVTDICADKWETHLAVLPTGINLPATNRYTPGWLGEVLEENKMAFIKKRNGTEGTGQAFVEKKGSTYAAYEKSTALFAVDSLAGILEWAESRNFDDKWIVQAGIDSARIDGRVMSFRSVFQRDGDLKLHETATYAIIGAEGSRQSNVGPVPGLMGYGAEPSGIISGWDRIREQISEMGTKAVAALEKACGEAGGEIGIDTLLSTDARLIFIEANTKLGHSQFERLAEMHGGKLKEAFGKFFVRPLRYARGLAGV
ncbi:MAG: hypothetical protein NT051_03030 [Candidatus Micrarchaeota archaeon]|nr:hypothetical protein [Candidatus Micrarchaeota archaeon]